MPYDVVAFEADEDARQLTEAEEGIFHRMLRLAWMNGSIPADLKTLAGLVRVRPSTMQKAWGKLNRFWVNDGKDFSRLRNKKQESERFFLESKRSQASAAGKLSAKLRQQKENESTDVQRKVNDRSTSQPSPSQPNPTEEEEKKRPTADAAAEAFVAAHQKNLGTPYPPKPADFVKLAQIRKAHAIGARASPEGWDVALENYFASPLSTYTLADLAARFPTFKNSRLDRYGKPVNHMNANGGRDGKTKTDRNLEAAERLRARWSAEDSGCGERGDFGGDPSGLR